MTTERLQLTAGLPRLTITQRDPDQPAVLASSAQGPAGIPGLPGPPGAQGLQGDPGPQGARGASTDTTIKTLAAGATASSITGSLTETSLHTYRLPKQTMGASGRIRITTLWSMTNNANNKTVRLRFGGMSGTVFHQEVLTTVRAIRIISDVENRDAVNSQVGKPIEMSGFGTSVNSVVTSAIDTGANDVDVCMTAQLANAGDTITLEAYEVELLTSPQAAPTGLYYPGDGIKIDPDYKIYVDRSTVPPVLSPVFSGNPQAPTQSPGDNTSKIATTAFVQGLIAGLSTVYLTKDPVAARAQLGLGALALLNLITWAQTDATLRAAVADYRSGADQKFVTPMTAFSAQAYVPLVDAANIVLDLNTGFNFSVTITTNRTLNFPINPKVGQNGFIDVTQPSTGSKRLDFQTGYTYDQGVQPQIDSTPSATTSLFYHVRSATEVRIGIAFQGVRALP